jgi:hypothetical protein
LSFRSFDPNLWKITLIHRSGAASATKVFAAAWMTLCDHHLRSGRTKHTLVDAKGARPFPPFTSLAITQFPGDNGFYLMHICADGSGTDTWHENIDEAIHQAEWEFGVQPSEWTETNEPF